MLRSPRTCYFLGPFLAGFSDDDDDDGDEDAGHIVVTENRMASSLNDLLAQRMRFGRLVRRLRSATGQSQTALATQAGLSLQRISRLERGHAVPREAEACALADAIATATREAVVVATPPPLRVAGPLVPGVAAGRFAPRPPSEPPGA
jgi:DNA-binding XRE family transcriptional regulator